MNRRLLRWLVAGVAGTLIGTGVPALAGIPCLVDGDGVALTWRTLPIPYHLDPGPLTVRPNRVISAEAAEQLVREAVGTWEKLDTATIRFATGPSLAVDIDEGNYVDVLGVCGDGLSPVVFDRTGGIIDAVLGVGASAAVLGFTLHDCDLANAPEVREATVVLNGTAFASLPVEEARRAFVGVLAHEFGHVLNLCHSWLHAPFVDDGDATNDGFVPLMFPYRSDDDPNGEPGPRFDDATMAAMLYPAPGLFDSTGTIAGHVVSGAEGQPVSGAAVIVRSVDDPLRVAAWTTSGWLRLEQINGFLATLGEPIPAIDGSYQVSGLPAGRYTVEVDGGTTGAGSEFFSGDIESEDPVTDPPTFADVLSVDAGTMRTDATVTLDRRVRSPLGETGWAIRWRGTVRVARTRARLPSGLLPDGRLEFLSTGRYRVSPLAELGGSWAPRGRRRIRHALPGVAVESVLDPAGGGIVIESVTGRGRTSRRLSRIRGRLVARGVLLFPRTRFRVLLDYRGTRLREPAMPGRLPLIPPP